MEHLAQLLNEKVTSLKEAIGVLREQRNRTGRGRGYNSQDVGSLDARIAELTNELRHYGDRAYREDIEPDGEDEFDFDLSRDDAEGDEELDFDDEDNGKFGDEDDIDDADADDRPENRDDGEEFDYDDDGETDDHEDDHGDTEQRLDDLEDKLTMILQKFSEVLAKDMVDDQGDDEEEFGGDDEEEFDADAGDDDGEEFDPDEDDLGDDGDVEEDGLIGYSDDLPDRQDVDDYDYENDPGDDDYRTNYQGNVRSREMEPRRRTRWKDHRLAEINRKRRS